MQTIQTKQFSWTLNFHQNFNRFGKIHTNFNRFRENVCVCFLWNPMKLYAQAESKQTFNFKRPNKIFPEWIKSIIKNNHTSKHPIKAHKNLSNIIQSTNKRFISKKKTAPLTLKLSTLVELTGFVSYVQIIWSRSFRNEWLIFSWASCCCQVKKWSGHFLTHTWWDIRRTL